MDNKIKTAIMNAAEDLKKEIVLKIKSDIPPPNAPSTIKAKGSSHTLIDTGNMWESVDYQILSEEEDSMDVAVGIFEEGIATYAIANEYGSTRTVTTRLKDNPSDMHQGYSIITIPERSFMRSTYDENIEEIMDRVSEAVGDSMSAIFKK